MHSRTVKRWGGGGNGDDVSRLLKSAGFKDCRSHDDAFRLPQSHLMYMYCLGAVHVQCVQCINAYCLQALFMLPKFVSIHVRGSTSSACANLADHLLHALLES